MLTLKIILKNLMLQRWKEKIAQMSHHLFQFCPFPSRALTMFGEPCLVPEMQNDFNI
jgi:hypothetical protein